MLNFGNKEFRNIQEQVEKNKEDISALKTGIKISYSVSTVSDLAPLMKEENVGKYIYVSTPKKLYVITHRANEGLLAESLGDYPAAEKGEQGEQGIQGVQGETGPSIYGVASILPSASAYKDGDMYLLSTGALYKRINGNWVLQCSIRGPQGVPGSDGDTVEANPSGTATDDITKIAINGVIYNIKGLTDAQTTWLNNAITAISTNGSDVTIDGDLNVPDGEILTQGIATDAIEAKTSGQDVELGSNLDVGGYSLKNVSSARVVNDLEVGNDNQTTGLIMHVHGDEQIHGDLILDSTENIEDTEGNKLFGFEGNMQFDYTDLSNHFSDATITIQRNRIWRIGRIVFYNFVCNISSSSASSYLAKLKFPESIRSLGTRTDNYNMQNIVYYKDANYALYGISIRVETDGLYVEPWVNQNAPLEVCGAFYIN